MKRAFDDLIHNPVFWVAVLYLLLPADLLADAIPVAGTIDDLVPIICSLIYQSRLASK